MAHIVIANFTDLDDKRRLNEEGQPYPREGYEPSEERIQALSTRNNKGGKPFIKKVEDPTEDEQNPETPSEFPKHTGGGWYELSNGEKVQGKEEAAKAENDLKGGE